MKQIPAWILMQVLFAWSCVSLLPSVLALDSPHPMLAPPTPEPAAAVVAKDTAIHTVSESNDGSTSNILQNVKAATDGIQLALYSAAEHDTSKMLKGIGDAVAVLPGALGYAGVAFSLAASVFAVVGAPQREDPILAALNRLQDKFTQELKAIDANLREVSSKMSLIITRIDQVLNDISEVPAKVVAEMKLTDVSQMKDKFAHVQRAAIHYAGGNLTRTQMIAKCDDFEVAALFSELETIVKDEKDLFGAKFGSDDMAHGKVQTQLLLFYISVIPLVTNCNSLKYSTDSLRSDGEKMGEAIQLMFKRASWYLAPADRTIFIRERFNPFGTAIDSAGYTVPSGGWNLALSFKAYSFVPPHAACFEVVGNGKRLEKRSLLPTTSIPRDTFFCLKNVNTDDAACRVVYAERGHASATSPTAIFQPELDGNVDKLDDRGWVQNVIVAFSPKVGSWQRLPQLKLISDFIIMQANSSKTSLEGITKECRDLGDGYDRDGDGHSKEYKNAPWTIFCVRYVNRTLREIDGTATKFLVDVQFNEVQARDAWNADCLGDGYQRDPRRLPIPSKIKKPWLGGITTVKSYAVCVKYSEFLMGLPPNTFLERVWLDDSVPMSEKPKQQRHQGDKPMRLPPPPTGTILGD